LRELDVFYIIIVDNSFFFSLLISVVGEQEETWRGGEGKS